jgi:hypothetical protein
MAASAEIARANGKKGGRPKGSTTRPQLRDYYNAKELAEFVEDLKKTAKHDPIIKKFVAEQIFGKAPQSLDLKLTDPVDAPDPKRRQQLEALRGGA